jgi:DNA-binding response OmpR family regulator
MPDRRASTNDPPAVIVIEDDLDARQIYAQYLRSKHWTVFTAADGRSGLTKINELTPDVIVLDLAMPRVDGWTVLKHVRESSITSKIPIVVVSAMSDARDSAFYAGCDAYLMKPCAPEVLYLQIRALSRFQAESRTARSLL